MTPTTDGPGGTGPRPSGASVDPEVVRRVADALDRGEAVVIPTDTVYGVAAAPAIPGATARLYALKGRRPDVPLAVLVAEPADLDDVATGIGPDVRELVGRHWPGPLTVVARRHPAFFPPLMLACLVFSLLSVEGLIRADGRPRYEALSRLSRPVYAAHGFDIMPCLYYAPSCRYVGDVGATPAYIGASHLPGIPAVPGWEGVTGEACYVVYRGEGQSPAPRLRERGYAPGAAPRGLGEDVYLQLYKMGN